MQQLTLTQVSLIMMLKRSLPVLAILQVAVAIVDSDRDFTLVQYLSSRFCSSDRYVCQPLELDTCTQLSAFTPHGGNRVDVYTKLTHDHDGEYKVQSCTDSQCNCGVTQDLTLDMCQGSAIPSGGTSRMLAKGKVSGCSRNDIDVALGKHHDRYEVQGIAPGGEMNKAKPPPTGGGEASPAESDEPEPSPAFELVKSGGLKPEALKQFRQRMRDAGDGKPPTTTTTTTTNKYAADLGEGGGE